MGEKFAEFDQYQLGKHGKKMKKNKIPIDFFGASSKDDSDQGNGSNMREWVGLNTKFVFGMIHVQLHIELALKVSKLK